MMGKPSGLWTGWVLLARSGNSVRLLPSGQTSMLANRLAEDY